MVTTKSNKIPKFESLEEEREYWEARGPLSDGHKGRISKPTAGQKRSSFLAVRLTGEELTQLRDRAAKHGVGPSTFARIVLTSAIEHENKLPDSMSLNQLLEMLENSLPQSVKHEAETLTKNVVIGYPNDPALVLIDESNIKDATKLALLFIKALLALTGKKVITPEDETYKKVKSIIDSQTQD